MKFKDFKEKIKNENYKIPDVYNKVKSYAYSKDYKTFKSTSSSKIIFKRLAYAIVPILLFAFYIISFSSNPINNNSTTIDNSKSNLTYFTSENEIKSTLLDYLKEKQKQNQIIIPGNNTSDHHDDDLDDEYSSNLPNNNYFNWRLQLNNNEPDIVKVDGNYIYTVTTNKFNVVKVDNGNMTLVYTENLTNNQSNNIKREIYFNDIYVIIISIQLQYNSYNQRQINVDIYNKGDFSKEYTYSIYAKYLGIRFINNQLYLVSNIDLSNFEDNDNLPLPEIYENNVEKNIDVTDISYINEHIGEAYTIITTIDLNNDITSYENIILTYNKWDIIYATNNGFYLVSNQNMYNYHIIYGNYISIIKYNYTNEGLKYHGSFTIDGYITGQSAIDEYNDYLRLAITVTEYQLNSTLFNHTVEKISVENKILILKEFNNNNSSEFNLVGQINKGLGKEKEPIKYIEFVKNKALLVTNNDTNPLYIIDLNNPNNPTIEDYIENTKYNFNIYNINDTNAIELYKTSTGSEFEVSLYNLKDHILTPWVADDYIINRNFFNQNNSSYIIIDAIENNKAFYVNQINNKYYLGFSVYDYFSTRGNYILFIIDLNNQNYQTKIFDHQTLNNDPLLKINRMVSINQEQMYYFTVSNKLIISYDQNFQQINSLEL